MKSVKQTDILTGSIPKQLLLFFLPIWFGTLFQQLYNTADTLIVGNFVGTNALAAVGATGPFVNLLVGLFVVLAAVCLLAARTLLPADREDPPLFPTGFSVASPGLLTPAVMGLFLLAASGVLDLLFGFSGASALTEAPASIATLTKDDLLNLLG